MTIVGLVVRGDGRGRQIGFPTANVLLEEGAVLPGEGVYAGWARRQDGTVRTAAISIGRRPTYYGDSGELVLEVFLLDFEGDLYGEQLEVGIELNVRGQESFESTEALVEQMHRDVAAVAAGMESRLPD